MSKLNMVASLDIFQFLLIRFSESLMYLIISNCEHNSSLFLHHPTPLPNKMRSIPPTVR